MIRALVNANLIAAGFLLAAAFCAAIALHVDHVIAGKAAQSTPTGAA